MPQEYIQYILQMNYMYAHYDLCALFFLSNSFTSWSWQESRSAPRCVHLSMNSCVEAAVSLPWCCYVWLCLIWQNAHVTIVTTEVGSALKISEVQVTRSLQWTRWQMCLFLSGPSRRPDQRSPCRVPRCEGILRDQRGSKMIKGQKRSVTWCDLMWPDVTWCDLDDAVSLWNFVNTRRGILEEMKNQNMLRFKASRRVPATSQGPGWKNFNALTFALKVVESSSSVYAKVMRLWLLGIVWDCVFISRLAWLCSDSSSSVWLEVEETKSDWTSQLPQFLSQFSLCFPCASFMGCGSFQSLEWSRVSRGYINRGL